MQKMSGRIRNARRSWISLLVIPRRATLFKTLGGRKVRWGRQGIGKRGGVRVVYFYYDRDAPLYLLMVYAKARREDLSPDEKRTVRELTVRFKQAHRDRGGRQPS